jgi:hypothetical protein
MQWSRLMNFADKAILAAPYSRRAAKSPRDANDLTYDDHVDYVATECAPELDNLRAATCRMGTTGSHSESAGRISNCAGQRSDHAQQLRLVRGQRTISARCVRRWIEFK